MQPIFTCFTENLNYALGWMVIHSLWQATAIAILSGIVALIVRKKSPQLRYWTHNAALLSVLIAAIVTFCLYFDFSKEVGQTIFVPEKVGTQINNLQIVDVQNSKLEKLAPLSMEGLRMYFNRNIYLIVTIWALGVALFMLKLLGGISYVYYLRSKLNFPADEYWLEMVANLGEKAGVKRGMELVESALVRSPMVVGHLKPMILFPIGAINKLNPQEVEAILSHEIAHVLRNDYVFNIIQSIIEALFYFHPAVWWISANIRTERENACDDVAIALCGNSMTYAKALVSVQEMAYYGSPQMAMAFAGQNKNKLLFRVQRILKQPHNKTNVMEKLIATCFLLVMMVALSFGGNRWNNNSFAEANTLKNISDLSSNSATNENDAVKTTLAVSNKHYIKFKVNGVLDSFPVGKDVADGNYNYADNKYQAKLTVKDHFVVKLNINGSEIAANEIKNHRGFINEIIMRSAAPPQYNEDIQPEIARFPESSAPPSTERFPSVAGMPTFSESNGDMVVSNSDGTQTVISHSGDGNSVQSVVTTHRDGSKSVTKTYKNGETISETFDKNGKKITSNSAGGYNNVSMYQGNNKTYINGKDITTFDNDGTKSIITVDDDGGKIVKIYKNGNQLTHTLKLMNGQILLDGRVATNNDIRALGWQRTNKGLQKIGGYANLQPVEPLSGTISTRTNVSEEDKGELYEDIKEQISDLKEEITECECTTNKEFRSKLVNRLDALKGKLNKGLPLNELQKLEGQFDQIHQDWENGECDENKSDKGSKGSKNSDQWGYSYGYGDSYAQAEKARKDAEKARKNSTVTDENGKATGSLFQNLVDKQLITLGKKCSFQFSNTELRVSGKSVSNDVFNQIKREFESKLPSKKNPTYSIAFAGIVNGVKSSGVELNGTFNTSINTD